jgi:hypothetical protein
MSVLVHAKRRFHNEDCAENAASPFTLLPSPGWQVSGTPTIYCTDLARFFWSKKLTSITPFLKMKIPQKTDCG